MKNLLLFLSVLFTCGLNAQDEFSYSKDGFNTTFIVVVVDSLKASEQYSKTLNWISETYKNPKEVIKAEILNEKIRITGAKTNMSSYVGHPTDLRYSIEIAFKDGKYKFEVISAEVNAAGGGFQNFDLTNGSLWFKKNGKIKGWYKNKLPAIQNTFNSLNQSLKDYILNNKKSDW
jgi:hypothetical protein